MRPLVSFAQSDVRITKCIVFYAGSLGQSVGFVFNLICFFLEKCKFACEVEFVGIGTALQTVGLVEDGALHLGVPGFGNLIKVIHIFVTIIMRL